VLPSTVLLYLITGGAGFIGSHLAWNIAKRGNRVRLLDNFDTGSRQIVQMLLAEHGDSVEMFEGDIRDTSACRSACVGVDYVLHHAAMASVPRSFDDPAECAEINLVGTACVLNAAKLSNSVRRVVFASSSAVYGDASDSPTNENDVPDPLSPYASSKLAGEHFCRHYARHLGLQTLSFRYFNVFGERQNPQGPYAAVIPKFIDAVMSRTSPVVYGDGEQVRDFVFIDDVVEANLRGCAAGPNVADGSVYNVGSGIGTTINGVLSELSSITGIEVAARYVPARPGDIRSSVATVERIRSAMGFVPVTSMRVGVRRMLNPYLGVTQ
jgi:UDP-N-acetylglucosamine/UDP-N-acetylgalactosamine 4-epimerase